MKSDHVHASIDQFNSTARNPLTTAAGRQAASALSPNSNRRPTMLLAGSGIEDLALLEPTTAAASVAFLGSLLHLAEEVCGEGIAWVV